jgi:hypothetical protein
MGHNATLTIARSRIDDEHRVAAAARRRTVPDGDLAAAIRWSRRATLTRRLTAITSVLAAVVLFASLPAMAGVPTTGAQPGPMPAPAPMVVSSGIAQH